MFPPGNVFLMRIVSSAGDAMSTADCRGHFSRFGGTNGFLFSLVMLRHCQGVLYDEAL